MLRRERRPRAAAARTFVFEHSSSHQEEEDEPNPPDKRIGEEKLRARLNRKKNDDGLGREKKDPELLALSGGSKKGLGLGLGLGEGSSFGIFSSPPAFNADGQANKKKKKEKAAKRGGGGKRGGRGGTSINNTGIGPLTIDSFPATNLPTVSTEPSRRKKRESQPLSGRGGRGRVRGGGGGKRRETVPNMSSLREDSYLVDPPKGNHSSLHLGSFEKKRQAEILDIEDNYNLHISDGTGPCIGKHPPAAPLYIGTSHHTPPESQTSSAWKLQGASSTQRSMSLRSSGGSGPPLPSVQEEAGAKEFSEGHTGSPDPKVVDDGHLLRSEKKSSTDSSFGDPSAIFSPIAPPERLRAMQGSRSSQEDAATSTPTGLSLPKRLSVGQDLKSDFSPIPCMSPEVSQEETKLKDHKGHRIFEDKEKNEERGKERDESEMDVSFGSGCVELRSLFSPDLDNTVVTLDKDNAKSDLTRRALRRLSVAWCSSLKGGDGLLPPPPPPPALKDLMEEEEGGSSEGTTPLSTTKESEGEKENETSAQLSTPELFQSDKDSQSGKEASMLGEEISRFSFTRRRKKALAPLNSSYIIFSDEDNHSHNSPTDRETGWDGMPVLNTMDYNEIGEREEEEEETESVDGDVVAESEESGSGEEEEEWASRDGSEDFHDALGEQREESETGLSFVSGVWSVKSEGEDSRLKTPHTEQKRNFSRLSVGNDSGSPYYLRGMVEEHSPMEDCLFVCQQDTLLTWTQAFSNKMMRSVKKIGEGVYGEVFRTLNPAHGENVALKVIPVEGVSEVNGERQKSFEEILPEILIAKAMSHLRHGDTLSTPNFVEVKSVTLVQGRYPKKLLGAWDKWDVDGKSQNDRPDHKLFPTNQIFIVFEFGDGGSDLESFQMSNVKEAYSILGQVAMALTVAEEALEFEHRDLHIGNILVKHTPLPTLHYSLNGHSLELYTFGVQVFIIDFTNSRLRREGCTIFTDLSTDEGLFEGPTDEYQFDVYRIMRTINSPMAGLDEEGLYTRRAIHEEGYTRGITDEESREGRGILTRLVNRPGELRNFGKTEELFEEEEGAFSEMLEYLLA